MARKKRDVRGDARRAVANARRTVSVAHGLQQALRWFAQDQSFTDIKLHGNVSWSMVQLVVLAVLWVWSDHRTLTGAFAQAEQLARELYGTTAVTSYQGLTGALRSYTQRCLPRLWSHLHIRMRQAAKSHWRIGKWLPLAVDGSRLSAPRTVSNERAFAAPRYGQSWSARSRRKWKNKRRRTRRLASAPQPQIWLTLVWHLGLKMPWCWRSGPSTSSERDHLRELLETEAFPEHTLFCADAGFVGYDFWQALQEHGQQFLIRVGRNVHLLRRLGRARQREGLVYLWPDKARRKQQPPLVLRLLEFQGARSKIYVVSSVLDNRELSLAQARELYRLRWGVELQFRAFKQTFGRRKLRSRTAANALVELDWSLVGLWLIQLFAVKEQIKVARLPADSSVALALCVIQDAMRHRTAEFCTARRLNQRLRLAIKDPFQRRGSKRARYRPNNKEPPQATRPIIQPASSIQRRAYQALCSAA